VILVVDNYDSFTFNLVQMIMVTGAEVRVVRNDEAAASDLLAARPSGIVLSPGPGRPESAGCCLDLVRLRSPVPLLGVCLGHQVLAQALGARVRLAARPVHGKTAAITHHGNGIFAGLDDPFEATRYHSLEVAAESLPPELEVVARSEDGVVMGIGHRQLPYWGVQFHPESIMTAQGDRLRENFGALCRQAQGESKR